MDELAFLLGLAAIVLGIILCLGLIDLAPELPPERDWREGIGVEE